MFIIYKLNTSIEINESKYSVRNKPFKIRVKRTVVWEEKREKNQEYIHNIKFYKRRDNKIHFKNYKYQGLRTPCTLAIILFKSKTNEFKNHSAPRCCICDFQE